MTHEEILLVLEALEDKALFYRVEAGSALASHRARELSNPDNEGLAIGVGRECFFFSNRALDFELLALKLRNENNLAYAE